MGRVLSMRMEDSRARIRSRGILLEIFPGKASDLAAPGLLILRICLVRLLVGQELEVVCGRFWSALKLM